MKTPRMRWYHSASLILWLALLIMLVAALTSRSESTRASGSSKTTDVVDGTITRTLPKKRKKINFLPPTVAAREPRS
ncbi:MAG: hypothetical protein HC884_09435 [Chloroflexaceae bacterium]|nr:hypothetical protein [Chloroflexaceae bacterium]